MGPVVAAAIIMSFPLNGSVTADGGDYAVVDFEVPAGTVEIEIEHHTSNTQNILDWGLWDPNGFRGWGGGLEENTIVGATAASRGYLPGPLPAGTWHIVIGKAQLRATPADYTITVTLKDAETQTAQPRASFEPVVLETGPRWYRGDFHVHSRQSGDATATFDQLIALARTQRLDFFANSDHNTIAQHSLWAARQPDIDDVLVLRAAEVTTYAGHANAFGISEYVDHRIGLGGRTAAGIVDDVATQGGLISINHPRLDLGGLCIGCAWNQPDTPWDRINALEIHTGNYETVIGLFTNQAMQLWEERQDAGNHLAALGGSDDHRAGMDTSATASPMGAPTTLVYATELSEAAILQGVREGRTVVMLRGPDDPMVELHISAGGERKMIGDTVTGARVELEAHVTGGDGMELVLYADGAPVESVPISGSDMTHTFSRSVADANSRYHVEVWNNTLPVTVTSHVYADYAPPKDAGCSAGGTGAGSLLLIALALLWLRRRQVSSTLRKTRCAGAPCTVPGCARSGR